MMRCVLFCCHKSSIFTAQKLIEKGCLVGFVVPLKSVDFHEEITFFAKASEIPLIVVSRSEMGVKLLHWLGEISPDVIIVNTFTYLLPRKVISLPQYGCWNFHGGLLPYFRGPVPVFWQLAQGVSELTMTLHKMDENLDSGPIFPEKKLKITDWDTHDVTLNRLAQKAPEMLDELFNSLSVGEFELKEQDESNAVFYNKPTLDEISIHWERMDASQIVHLIRACNLVAGGAITYLRASEFRIYEAEAIPLTDPPKADPGTIAAIKDDPNLYVLCRDSSLIRISVIGMSEAVSSGINFKKMLGLTSGEKFTSKMEA